eukprot:711749-Lingulodinium_polyedra.AAC.1
MPGALSAVILTRRMATRHGGALPLNSPGCWFQHRRRNSTSPHPASTKRCPGPGPGPNPARTGWTGLG